MKFFPFLALTAFSFVVLAADKKTTTTFKKYHTKSLSSTPLKLDDASFAELTALPREFAIVVLLTAMPAQFGCQLCRQFQPEWDILAKSWVKGDKKGDSKVLYGTLDFPDGKGTFQKVRRYITRNIPG